jgi:hypothetical protein
VFKALRWHPAPKEGDRRFRARSGKSPVNVEATIIEPLTEMGRPATLEEIMFAWGRLRERRRTGSLAG